MSRAHYVENVLGVSGSGALSLMAGATVHVYDEGTTTPIAQTIYDADSGGGTLSNPLTSDANGKVEFWLATAARVDLAISKVGFTSQTRTVDVEDAPGAASGGGGETLLHRFTADGSTHSFGPVAVANTYHTVKVRNLLNLASYAGADELVVAVILSGDTNQAHYVGQASGSYQGPATAGFIEAFILPANGSWSVTEWTIFPVTPPSGVPVAGHVHAVDSGENAPNYWGARFTGGAVTSVTVTVGTAVSGTGTVTPLNPDSGSVIEVWAS